MFLCCNLSATDNKTKRSETKYLTNGDVQIAWKKKRNHVRQKTCMSRSSTAIFSVSVKKLSSSLRLFFAMIFVREQWRTSKRLHDCSAIFARTHRSHFIVVEFFKSARMHPGGCESKYFISFTLGVSIKYLKINPGVKKFFIKIINYTPGWECSDQSAPSLHSKFYNSNRWNFESGCQVLFRCSCKPGGASGGAGSVASVQILSFAVSCSLPSTTKNVFHVPAPSKGMQSNAAH